jgi:hypothetical protein
LKVFVSYRRNDTSGFAGRLVDGLADHFGQENIFRDVDSIPAGKNFALAINSAVAACDVLVVVIGREWLDATDASGQRRLDNPNDFVRLEIAAALERRIPVVPVLVEGAVMPAPTALPPPLADLSLQNALEVSDSRWDHDVERLVSAIRPQTHRAGPRSRRWVRPAVGTIVAVAAILAGAALLGDRGGGAGTDKGNIDSSGGPREAAVRVLSPDTTMVGYGEEIEIEASSLPAGEVWFVVETSGEGHYQPDAPPLRTATDRWVGKVWAGDVDSVGLRFVLHVVVASAAASDVFSGYLEHASTTGLYPGFPGLPDGAQSVAAFSLTRR